MLVDDAVLEALHQTMSRLEVPWAGPIPDNREFFAYEALPIAIFLEGLAVVSGKRFLDVGCGIGTKLALMYYLGWDVAGIDRHAPYIEAARELVPSADLAVADAFDVPFFDADVVYAYRPCVAADRELALERHIVSSVKPGTFVWLPSRILDEPLDAEYLGSGVWRV